MKKLLIANRGEIAVRIIRAAQEAGIRTVAVFSEADRFAMHTALADEAIFIGPPEPHLSYLDISRIIDAARLSGADAIHPGYGFLSERAEFADSCVKADLIFVGPTAEAMRRLGDKMSAKHLAVEASVPIAPGFFEPGASPARLKDEAARIGYPIMLKASAGGGGRGMRVVRQPADFLRELDLASEEALKAFGDGTMMVEKLIERTRHIEVQILADNKGNVGCLFERECSLQRRHQKVVEEAPSPIGDALWPKLRESVERLVRVAGYTNAGTAEFMFDQESGDFYFLEVNARLQVEHPVTEAITGLDLVRAQLRVAEGGSLDLPPAVVRGERNSIHGHAIEARIVAEDPARDFAPSIGKIIGWAEPKRPGIRVDTGYEKGSTISHYYDSLLAKVIAFGEDRPQAISRLEAALQDFHVLGVKTNIGYLLDVLRHHSFREGEIDTGFLGREFPHWTPPKAVPAELSAILSISTPQKVEMEEKQAPGAWDLQDSFRP